jgi:hypothetical protein
MKACDLDVGSIVGEEEDRTIVFIVRIKDLCAREAIPPGLSVAVENTGAIYLNVSRITLALGILISNIYTHFPPQTQNVILFWKS